METLFCSQESWDLVENGFTKPLDQAAYNALSQTQNDLLKGHVPSPHLDDGEDATTLLL